MVLRFERQRLLDYVAAEKARILPDLKKMRGRRQALGDFIDTGEALFTTLDSHLEGRIALTVDRIGRYDPDLASNRLNELFEGIKALLFLFASVAERQNLIPGELYETVSWFFSRCTGIVPAPRYVLSTSESFETNELHQFVYSLLARPRNRHLFPELKKICNAPFFFIFLPTSTAIPDGTLDWPILFHECVHAVEEQANVIGKLFPGLPRGWAELDELANHDDTAKEALWTLELTCDSIATFVGGPGFLWRLLVGFFSLSAISHYSTTHPNMHTRIDQLIRLTRTLGFTREAKLAKSSLTRILKELRDPRLAHPDPAPKALAKSVRHYAPLVTKFDKGAFERGVTKKLGKSASSLVSDILGKRPVVTDPAGLFALISFREEIGRDPKLAPVLADFLRLHFVEERFHALNLRG